MPEQSRGNKELCPVRGCLGKRGNLKHECFGPQFRRAGRGSNPARGAKDSLEEIGIILGRKDLRSEKSRPTERKGSFRLFKKSWKAKRGATRTERRTFFWGGKEEIKKEALLSPKRITKRKDQKEMQRERTCFHDGKETQWEPNPRF